MKALLPFVLALPLLLTACGADNSKSSQTSQLEQAPGIEQTSDKNLSMGMNLDLSKLQSTGVAADKIVVTISKGEFTKIIETSHIDYAASVEFSELTIGEYSISVQVFDGETLVAEGLGLGAVSANQVATVNMDIELLSGGLVVNVNVPEEIEYEVFSSNVVLTTTLDRLDGSIIYPSNLYSGFSEDAMYHNSAAYAQLDLGTEMQLDMAMSYRRTSFIDSFFSTIIVQSEDAHLNLKVGETNVASCTRCIISLQKEENSIVMNYSNIALNDIAIERLTDIVTGEDLIDALSGAVLERELDHINVEVKISSIDESSIKPSQLRNGDLLDSSKYKTTMKITRSAGDNNLSFLLIYPNLGLLLANN